MDVFTILENVLMLVGAASLIVQALAIITGITPSTRDDEIVSQIQKVLLVIQRVLSKAAFNEIKPGKTP